jgi:pSer/pThr/pTyr-binding forkhead associated (FHA) protein
MADIPVLVCTDGALAGQRFVIPDGGVGIGRSDDNAVVVTDEGVSRFHARLLFDNGSLWLQDAGSRNGVFVNDVRVTGHKALKVGDRITVAQHRFELHWLDALNTPEPRARAASAPPDARPRGGADGKSDAGDDGKARRRWYWPF